MNSRSRLFRVPTAITTDHRGETRPRAGAECLGTGDVGEGGRRVSCWGVLAGDYLPPARSPVPPIMATVAEFAVQGGPMLGSATASRIGKPPLPGAMLRNRD